MLISCHSREIMHNIYMSHCFGAEKKENLRKISRKKTFHCWLIEIAKCEKYEISMEIIFAEFHKHLKNFSIPNISESNRQFYVFCFAKLSLGKIGKS